MAMETRLSEEIGAVYEHLSKVEQRLREHTETVETRLLGEFWKWARTAEMRYNQVHATVNGVDQRLQVIEDRVAEVERSVTRIRLRIDPVL